MLEIMAYLNFNSGIRSDKLVRTILELNAGFSLDTLKNDLAGLHLHGYELKLEPFRDKGIRGSRFEVVLPERDSTTLQTRHLSDIVALLNASTFSPGVRETSLAIFQCLAEAEATVHGISVEEVHFHEVGAVDAIVDITGAAIAIQTLGITRLYASALPLTTGHVKTAHGLLPVPAPAALEILRRVAAPWKACPVEGELVTP